MAEQLKKGGAAIPAVRPGKQTAEYVTNTLTRMSILGSLFLGAPDGLTAGDKCAAYQALLECTWWADRREERVRLSEYRL